MNIPVTEQSETQLQKSRRAELNRAFRTETVEDQFTQIKTYSHLP